MGHSPLLSKPASAHYGFSHLPKCGIAEEGGTGGDPAYWVGGVSLNTWGFIRIPEATRETANKTSSLSERPFPGWDALTSLSRATGEPVCQEPDSTILRKCKEVLSMSRTRGQANPPSDQTRTTMKLRSCIAGRTESLCRPWLRSSTQKWSKSWATRGVLLWESGTGRGGVSIQEHGRASVRLPEMRQ